MEVWPGETGGGSAKYRADEFSPYISPLHQAFLSIYKIYAAFSMSNPTESDLIFSEQANHNFSKTLGDLKRSTLSIHNRLRSIEEDAAFAQKVRDAFNKPLIANERCGSWYIDPITKEGSAYFKSTDGHTGVWKFSSRRLNLHLLEIIGKNDGLV